MEYDHKHFDIWRELTDMAHVEWPLSDLKDDYLKALLARAADALEDIALPTEPLPPNDMVSGGGTPSA